MKEIIKNFLHKLKILAIWLAVIAVILGGLYLYFHELFQPTEYNRQDTSTSTPEIVVEYRDREIYEKLVQEIKAKEAEYWENKAQLSAERQASEQLAKQFSEQANQKRKEEESL